VGFRFHRFGTRGSQVQILSPRPTIQAKLRGNSGPQKSLDLRTGDFGPQVDHDLIAGARFGKSPPSCERAQIHGPRARNQVPQGPRAPRAGYAERWDALLPMDFVWEPAKSTGVT